MKKNDKINPNKEVISEAVPYLVIILVVIIIRTFIATPIKVNGPSMETTLYDGNLMILNKLGAKVNGLKRFDIVVVKTNKTYNNFPIEKTFENVIPNEDVINQCINHYSDELDNLDNIEAFLEKQKKDIQDAFTKGHFKNLKKTLKGVPHY